MPWDGLWWQFDFQSANGSFSAILKKFTPVYFDTFYTGEKRGQISLWMYFKYNNLESVKTSHFHSAAETQSELHTLTG